MPADSSAHPDESVVEAYSMHRLEEPLLSAYEEHLLVCEACQERLRRMDVYVDAMRRGARRVQE